MLNQKNKITGSMKTKINIKAISALLTIVLLATVIINGCKVPADIASKSGAQLWGENCNRCHNTPDPATLSDDQWDAAVEHMHQKAILTDAEAKKILAFLKSAN
jgi:cytochrome c5